MLHPLELLKVEPALGKGGVDAVELCSERSKLRAAIFNAALACF
jgi:hypothetical protein